MTLVKTPIWDFPIRIFHWTLVLAVVAAIITAKLGGDYIIWHGRLGLLIAGLLIFRLIWGFFGSYTARFTQFFPNLVSIKAYLHGKWMGIGHNPLGALSVFAILSILIIQAVSGLFMTDDVAYQGYLASLVNDDCRAIFGEIHEIGEKIIFILIFLHIASIIFYKKIKKHDLISPMLTGYGDIESSIIEQNPLILKKISKIFLVIAIIISLSIIYLIANLEKFTSTPEKAVVTQPKKADW